jgi:hypothetical protein
MSAIVRFNHENVLIDYGDPGDLRDFHRDYTPKPSDRERCALVRQRDAIVAAERKLRTIRFALADVTSDAAGYVCEWVDHALRDTQRDLIAIRRAMSVTWNRLDMAPDEIT